MASWRESGPDMAGPFWRDVDELEKAGCVPDIPTQTLRVESLRSRGGWEGEGRVTHSRREVLRSRGACASECSNLVA